MIERIKDPVSYLTHLVGAILSVLYTVILTLKAYAEAGPLHVFAFLIFGITLVLLYSASALYHMVHASEKNTKILRRIDHIMIFVLIAGTYTPICLLALPGLWGIVLLVLVWGLAFGGIFLKIFWLGAPRWLSTSIYVLMGWLVLIAFFPLKESISVLAFMLLAAGGLFYTLGALIYAIKWLPFRSKYLGFHEVFHLFVLAGSAAHAFMMFQLIP